MTDLDDHPELDWRARQMQDRSEWFDQQRQRLGLPPKQREQAKAAEAAESEG